jgi:PAS domain S-box-containing protein
VVLAGAPLSIVDARVHPLVMHNPATLELGIVGYLSVPVTVPAGDGGAAVTLGTVCVVDTVPRAWTAAEVAILEDLATAAVDEIVVRTAARQAVQAAERQMSRLLAAAGEGVLGTDAEGRTTFVNPAAERALGWSAAELIGRDQHEAIHHSRPDGAPYPKQECPLSAARRDGRPYRADDEHFWRRDGSAIPVEFAMTPVIEDGRVAGTVLTFRDITERKRAESAERVARLDAERANRVKGEFLAVMSHELRTPLNAIGGYTDLIDMGLRGPVTAAQRADLARIRRSQQHLLGLINDVLNFAKLESGRAHFAITDVSLREALDDVESLVGPQVAARGLRYAASSCEPTVWARADREKLQQVLVNLLSNAAKFTEPPGTIALSCESDGTVVRVHVRDTGMGIPPDRLAHIFDPYVQVDPRLARSRDGAGLGLAISRDLARAMGGDLTVASTLGVGSVFTLTLPRGRGAERPRPALVHATGTEAVVARVQAVLAEEGVHAALRLLNERTPHRFTGLYRFDPPMLRNVALYDADQPGDRLGEDGPLAESFCSLVAECEGTFATADARTDPRVARHPGGQTIASYCGVLVRDAAGAPVGTLCHYDLAPRADSDAEVAVLEGVAPLFAPAVAFGGLGA